MARLEAAFRQHLSQVPFHGWAVVCQDDPVLSEKILPQLKCPTVTYGLSRNSDCQGVDLAKRGFGFSFGVLWQGKRVARVTLKVPGRHNVLNALAASAAAHLAGASWPSIAMALGEYKGIRRRMEVVGHHGQVLFLDDYGHHPTEIAATLKAAREFYARGRLLVCFQPHRYSRTKQLARLFGPALKGADFVWVCPIYSASEKPIPGVSEKLVLDALRKAGVACASYPGRALDLRKDLRHGDTFLTVGAGDVWKIGEDLARRMHG